MRISIVFVIIWILGFETPGQTPRFDRFDISTGLSQNNINGLVIDDVGNVWVGTLDGLNRYNGYEFDVFKPLAGEGGHISGNHVIDMGEGLDGDVWITTRDGMLNRFEPGRGQFIQYGDSVFQESEIYSVRNLIQINDSLLFYSHDAFVGVLNIYQNVCKTKKAPGFVHGITAKGDSAIIHGSFGLVYVKPFSSGKETTIQFSPIAEAPCYHLHRSDNDWYAVTEQGISCFDASFTEKKTVVMFDQVELAHIQSASVNSFAVQGETFWLGDDNFLVRIKKVSGKYYSEFFSYDAENDYSFKGHHVTKLQVDRLGNLWIGTLKNGVNHFNYVKNQFSHYHWKSRPMNSPDIDPVRAICKTSDGDLWLGFDREGLGIISENNEHQVFNYYYTKEGDKNKIANVRAIYEDSQNNIWIGVANQLCLYNREKGIIETAASRFLWDWPYRCYSVKELRKGMVTITATFSIGTVNLETGGLETTSLIPDGENITGAVRDVVEDCDGNIWVAKDEKGLLKIDGENRQLSSIRKATHDISDNKAYCLLASGDSLWIGTNSGLNLWSLSQSRVIRKFFERDGLSNNIVYSLNLDSQGYLWMSTNRGISRFNPLTEQFKTYLVNDFFMDDAHFEDDNGRIYYGGYTGVVAFHPERIGQPDINLVPTLNKFSLFNREILPGDSINGEVILKKPLDETEEIRLKYHQNSFTIDFNAYPFDYPNHNTFRYRLSGLQNDWIHSDGSSRQAAYTVVPPGEYDFELQAAPFQNEFGSLRVLKIMVAPPFWQTTWFKISVLVMLLSAVFWGYQLRLKQIRKRNVVLKSKVEEQTRALRDRNKQIVEMSEKLHEADQSKLQFFTNISHDFKTPLTLILAHVDSLNSKKSKALQTIRNNALQLLNLINQMIDLRKLDRGQLQLSVSKFDMVEFSSGVVNSFRVWAQQKEIDLKFFSTLDNLDVWLDRDKVEKIISNLLTNAIKYTPKGRQVLVTLSEEANAFHLDVEDEGIGISDEEMEHIFTRFYRSDGGQKHASGHGIGLTIVKGLIDIQKGTIDIKSRVNEGTKFHLTFLKGYQHFAECDFKECGYSDLYAQASPVSVEPRLEFARFGEKKILVVEDNLELMDFLNEILQPYFTVQTAGQGEAALTVLNDFEPDLIISDIMMPVMDGITFCRQVKSDIRNSHIPFILLTAKTDVETHVEGFELGVDDFVEKPFNSRILLARLKSLLDNREKLKRHFSEMTDSSHIISGLSKRDQAFMDKINHVIDQCFDDPLFNVEKLSEEMFMSRSTFYRKFKDLTGISAADYIRRTRLHKAALFLKHDELPISQVAENVGFQSLAHFRKCFKTEFGETPSNWGNKNGMV